MSWLQYPSWIRTWFSFPWWLHAAWCFHTRPIVPTCLCSYYGVLNEWTSTTTCNMFIGFYSHPIQLDDKPYISYESTILMPSPDRETRSSLLTCIMELGILIDSLHRGIWYPCYWLTLWNSISWSPIILWNLIIFGDYFIDSIILLGSFSLCPYFK